MVQLLWFYPRKYLCKLIRNMVIIRRIILQMKPDYDIKQSSGLKY